jgi:hypothetical protein
MQPTPRTKGKPVSKEEPDLTGIKEELGTISLALSIIAMTQAGAGDADERRRHEQATTKALDLLLKRIEVL